MNDETAVSWLISSADVDGTEVYSRMGNRVGHIDHLMIDRLTGSVAYAVMHFGGISSVDGDPHPVPWEALKYDTRMRGYIADTNSYFSTNPYWL